MKSDSTEEKFATINGQLQTPGKAALLDEFMQEAKNKCTPSIFHKVLDYSSDMLVFGIAGFGAGSEFPLVGNVAGAGIGAIFGAVHATTRISDQEDACLAKVYEGRLKDDEK